MYSSDAVRECRLSVEKHNPVSLMSSESVHGWERLGGNGCWPWICQFMNMHCSAENTGKLNSTRVLLIDELV